VVSSYQAKFVEPTRETYPLTESFMSRSFVTVAPDLDIYQAIDILIKNKISGALVVNSERALVGIVSEKDCLKLVTKDSFEHIQGGGPVEHFMTRDLVTIQATTGLAQVASLFLEHPFKKLPVLRNDRLVGVVRRRDVLVAMQEFYKKQMAFLRTN